MDKPLPSKYINSSNTSRDVAETFIKDYLTTHLPRGEKNEVEGIARIHFHLGKPFSDKKKQVRKKKKTLTREDRIKLGLLKFPKTSWKYKELQSMRDLWIMYMEENLKQFKRLPTIEDPEWPNFSLLLAKMEFIGAEMKVDRSKCHTYVGISGTCVYETKFTFIIVQPNNKCTTVLKEPCIFTILVNSVKFTVFGKHLLTRSTDRSSKKVRTQMLPDL